MYTQRKGQTLRISTIHSNMGQGITTTSVPGSLSESVSPLDVEQCLENTL